jgi:hypothetical protein
MSLLRRTDRLRGCPNWIDKALYQGGLLLTAKSRTVQLWIWMSALASIVVNLASGEASLGGVVGRLVPPRTILDLAIAALLIAAIVLLAARGMSEWIVGNRAPQILRRHAMRNLVASDLRRLVGDRLACGSAVSLLVSPFTRGWPIERTAEDDPRVEIRLQLSMSASKLERSGEDEVAAPERALQQLRLHRIPIAFTDSPTLVLELVPSNEVPSNVDRHGVARRWLDADHADRGSRSAADNVAIEFAHVFEVQALLVTGDDFVLATRPGANTPWTVSIRAPFTIADATSSDPIATWVRRTSNALLRLPDSELLLHKSAILGVFVEVTTDLCALACVVSLRAKAATIRDRCKEIGTDCELWDWCSFRHQLVRPGVSLHPANRYVMLLTLNHRLAASRTTRYLCGESEGLCVG